MTWSIYGFYITWYDQLVSNSGVWFSDGSVIFALVKGRDSLSLDDMVYLQRNMVNAYVFIYHSFRGGKPWSLDETGFLRFFTSLVYGFLMVPQYLHLWREKYH